MSETPSVHRPKMGSKRLPAGYWPVNVGSRSALLSSGDMADILTKVNETKSSMKLFDGLQQEVSKMARETTVAMFAVLRNGRGDDQILRRRKAELEEELMLTRDRLNVTADDMLKMKSKMSLLQSENEYLRRQLNKKSKGFSKSALNRSSGGNDSKDCAKNIDRNINKSPCKKEGMMTAYCNVCCAPCASCMGDCAKICKCGCKLCCECCASSCNDCFACFPKLLMSKCCKWRIPDRYC